MPVVPWRSHIKITSWNMNNLILALIYCGKFGFLKVATWNWKILQMLVFCIEYVWGAFIYNNWWWIHKLRSWGRKQTSCWSTIRGAYWKVNKCLKIGLQFGISFDLTSAHSSSQKYVATRKEANLPKYIIFQFLQALSNCGGSFSQMPNWIYSHKFASKFWRYFTK